MSLTDHRAFPAFDDLDAWLRANHDRASELWVRIYKKSSGTPSVDWNDCVLAALTWGWIDGHKRSLDAASFLQRLTPRRPKSSWSKRNQAHAERLIAEGRMQPGGLAQVKAAKADGRWERAYAGSATMVMPDDFLAALKKDRAALKFYQTLDRANLYAIYHRLVTASRAQTRAGRITAIVARLARGEVFHERTKKAEAR